MEYGPIPPSKFDDVIHHLRYNFPDEPLNASVGLCMHGQPCELLEHHDLMTLKDGLSVMAVDKDTEVIAGVALNGIARQGDTERSLEEMKSIDNVPYQRIFGLLNSVNKEIDLFGKYNVDKIFELRILSVDSNYRGKGVAKELFSRSEIIAEEHGFKLMKVDATSLFTQKISESFGFHVEKSVKYGDYKDADGKKIYDTKSPHDYYKVMVKQLPSNG
ncbi:hypothetical protein NQ315_003836 [Exocentrus adspersus]|uniref:aralkylamine N-acetyltransferase n=1 Tax=Exocentrus adspersus TaxID=1586481 RepID=A0AAV8VY72_9CUCU|nr:hypothetical protein NQ315_003836 [Exocentrus adspersus]